MTTSTIIWILTCLSFFGASMFISALIDILALASLHLRMATSISGAIYRAELAALYALWNLFRGKRLSTTRAGQALMHYVPLKGKRWNALRNRVDSYDYEIDQLFLGTLLFTIALFLLPTIVTYYLFFAVVSISASLVVIIISSADETVLSP
jgi:phosphatidylinositol glycan class Q protein